MSDTAEDVMRELIETQRAEIERLREEIAQLRERLRMPPGTIVGGLQAEIERLRAENDQLLFALKTARHWVPRYADEVMRPVDATVAKAEGKQ